MKLSAALKAKRNELISELHHANPGRPYTWAIEEGCRILREAVAAAEACERRISQGEISDCPHRRTEAAAADLTAADFAEMPADELAARIFRATGPQ